MALTPSLLRCHSFLGRFASTSSHIRKSRQLDNQISLWQLDSAVFALTSSLMVSAQASPLLGAFQHTRVPLGSSALPSRGGRRLSSRRAIVEAQSKLKKSSGRKFLFLGHMKEFRSSPGFIQVKRRPGVVTAPSASNWDALPAVAAAGLSVLAILVGAQLREKALEVLGGGAFNAFILSKLTELEKPYKPYPLLTNRHVETIFAAFFRSLPSLTYRRECLRMADGGTVALDWPQPEIQDPKAVLILLPGLTGGSDDTYVQHLTRRASKQGWQVVVFNSRGCADSPVTTPQFYSASFTEDLRQVVKHTAFLFPSKRVYAAGWSLGANILVRYLGQEAERCPLSGAVSLCNPFDLVVADEDFHIGFNNVYDKSLANGLRKIFAKHAHLFEDIGGDYNIHLVANATTVRDFDDGLTKGFD
uniref:AB hydrolase-1 domain-containing protein n=2 Tax=Physcomitrium patens TaxID=3218 RepID=A0A7I4CUT1_PHYPA